MSLILSRRSGQEIVIAECITVKVIQVMGQHVTLAIDAPNTVSVDRMEVHLKKQQEKNGVEL